MEQAKNALRLCLRSMKSKDRFNIVMFDDQFDLLYPRTKQLGQQAFDLADSWVKNIEPMGGSEILPAIKAAFRSFSSKEDTERIMVLITDA